MRTSHAATITLLAVAILHSTPATPNVVVERALDVRLAEADVVVVATAASTREGADGYVRVTLRVDSVLKGSPGPTISFIPESDIAELDTRCCVIGGRYLLFLSRCKKGDGSDEYASTDGPFGVYRLDRTENLDTHGQRP